MGVLIIKGWPYDIFLSLLCLSSTERRCPSTNHWLTRRSHCSPQRTFSILFYSSYFPSPKYLSRNHLEPVIILSITKTPLKGTWHGLTGSCNIVARKKDFLVNWMQEGISHVSRESRGGRARRGREVLHLAETRGSSLSCRASVAGVSESSKKKKVNGIGTKIYFVTF